MFQDITFEQKYKENSDWLNQTMLGFISKRRNEINNNIQSDGKICSNLLDILLTLNTPLDPNYDGSEAPLTYQEVCSTITEVSVGGNKRNFGDDISRQISYEDLENFTYLDAIIKESARVYAVVPLSSHVSTQVSIVGGNHLEANTNIFVEHEINYLNFRKPLMNSFQKDF
ncbi:hypothetical protein RhiirA5_442230 [Rhizophagus irregularis]|uniref:Cytochrome P450 n=1 Tax=Rhizophagus irregularis TaxID=588596 RepID=A0A2N0NEY0_9GLOM|nr:hypothetical protein RhiirA5_442230 [Rhizophagus irregularis]CAB4478825.1 unnamed protein product [Rhizophagus irregularis]